jgi:hypothetical protein
VSCVLAAHDVSAAAASAAAMSRADELSFMSFLALP